MFLYIFIPNLSLIILAFIFYLICLRTNNKRKDKLKPLIDKFIAHRGLFNNIEAPENSLLAFSRAIDKGYAIEFDVQLTLDGIPVIFHDGNLKRIIGVDKELKDCTYLELNNYLLLNSEERIPTLKETLDLINGKVPLLIEIKSEGDPIKTLQETLKLLDDYKGYYVIESFHLDVLRYLKKYRKEIIRGQLSTNYFKEEPSRKWIEKFILSNLLSNLVTKPDFIAYNHLFKNQFSYRVCRKLYKPTNFAWTIKSQAQLEIAQDVFEGIIFDGFIPLDK